MSLGYVAPERSSGFIEPAVVLRKMRELNAQNRALASRIGTKETGPIVAALGVELVRSWAVYYAEWRQFYADNQSYFARWTSGTVEILVDMINRSNSFDTQLRGVGLTPNTLSREEVERQTDDNETRLPTWAKTLLVFGGLGVSGYLLWTIARVMREGRLIAGEVRGGKPSMAGLRGGRQTWAVYQIVKVPSWEYADEDELDLSIVTRPTKNRETAVRQMRKLERGNRGVKYVVNGAGLAGLRGPQRVSDLDGPSTYNLEIQS